MLHLSHGKHDGETLRVMLVGRARQAGSRWQRQRIMHARAGVATRDYRASVFHRIDPFPCIT